MPALVNWKIKRVYCFSMEIFTNQGYECTFVKFRGECAWVSNGVFFIYINWYDWIQPFFEVVLYFPFGSFCLGGLPLSKCGILSPKLLVPVCIKAEECGVMQVELLVWEPTIGPSCCDWRLLRSRSVSMSVWGVLEVRLQDNGLDPPLISSPDAITSTPSTHCHLTMLMVTKATAGKDKKIHKWEFHKGVESAGGS